jgi:uncharacterized protein (TIGR02145 family)
MKRSLLLFFLTISVVVGNGQGITLSFVGKSSSNQYIQLDSIKVRNITQNWLQTLVYPDTTLTLEVSGVPHHGDERGVELFQNTPNPFDAVTELKLRLQEDEQVRLHIYDLNGRIIAQMDRHLPAGTHSFKVTLSTPQTYLLKAVTAHRQASIKMLNHGHSAVNRIEYIGAEKTEIATKEVFDESGEIFSGDLMMYEGYATIAGDVHVSTPILQEQYQSESIDLVFQSSIDSNGLGKFLMTDTIFLFERDNCDNSCIHKFNFLVKGYKQDAIMQTVNDLLYARLKIEHSFLGDLYIGLTCPNGQTASIANVKYEPRTDCGYDIPLPHSWDQFTGDLSADAVFGIPNLTNGNDYCDAGSFPMGTPWNYCWSENTDPNYGIQYAQGLGYVFETVNHTDNRIDSTDVVNLTNVYRPYQSFDQLVGCPLNGKWSITVIDGYPSDNGWITEAELAFKGELADTTAMPIVATNPIAVQSLDSLICGGMVYSQGGYPVHERGICWSVNPEPTLYDRHISCGSGSGSFTGLVTMLEENTTYYFRAYAVNVNGVSYGVAQAYHTTVPCGQSYLYDYDGNAYTTVQIGQQCWMRMNLRTDHYSNGNPIPLFYNPDHVPDYVLNNDTTRYRFYPGKYKYHYDLDNTIGYLYNWRAAVRKVSNYDTITQVQGVCPDGWHLPNWSDWNELLEYVKTQPVFWCDSNSENVAKALADTTYWVTNMSGTCTPGYNHEDNNATGFSAKACGRAGAASHGDVWEYVYRAYFWGTTSWGSSYSCYIDIISSLSTVQFSFSDIYNGYSVRCVKND